MENRKNPNFVYLRGNLGRDPELRNIGEYKKVNFSIAVNRKWTSKGNEPKSETMWVDCEFWNDKADEAMEILKKGSYIELEGTLVLDQWDDKATGTPRSKHYVKGFEFNVLDGSESETPSEDKKEAPKKRGRKPKATATVAADEGSNADADIPF